MSLAPQATPEHEKLGSAHTVGGIELKVAQVTNCLEHIRGGTVEHLGAHGHAASLLGGQGDRIR